MTKRDDNACWTSFTQRLMMSGDTRIKCRPLWCVCVCMCVMRETKQTKKQTSNVRTRQWRPTKRRPPWPRRFASSSARLAPASTTTSVRACVRARVVSARLKSEKKATSASSAAADLDDATQDANGVGAVDLVLVVHVLGQTGDNDDDVVLLRVRREFLQHKIDHATQLHLCAQAAQAARRAGGGSAAVSAAVRRYTTSACARTTAPSRSSAPAERLTSFD